MTSLNINASRLSAMAAGVVGLLAAGFSPAIAQQQPQQQVPQGWFKACTKQEDIDICNVQNIMTAQTGQLVTGVSLIELKGKINRKVFQVTVPTGQLVTGVSLIELKGKINRKVFQVTVPTGRLVPPGIGMQIDNGKAQKLDYAICFPDRCIAEAPLSDQLVANLKKGSVITLTSINFQNQQNPIKVTLEGFTGAYDGPALQQSDIEDRQKKLQDFVAKNNEDFAKKLKEEQDKAKAGN